ncbi:MAG: SusC/RagA family TonB-linked outer membrane protein [Chitinophagia bacterium]|jgi:TonB-linked SusC/RagA family outer membrane protein
MGKQIARMRAFLLFVLIFSGQIIFAQNFPLTGKVIDAESKQPIEAASISEAGKKTNTLTNKQGEFTLLVAQKGAAITISSVGYEIKKIAANATPISIELIKATENLNEVVVTALGIKKEKRKLGYSTQDVKGADLVKAREVNPINNLVGKVAGLTVGINNEMLRLPNLVLRGGRVNLIVVDGVPINSDTWNISPDDIESYNVLKGPVASALYGYRGQNGAIIINTKKGTKDRRGYSVEVNSSTTVQKGFIALPKTQDEYGPGDHGTYAFVDGLGGGTNDADYDIWGPKFEGQLIPQYDSPVDPVTGKRSATPWVARGKDNLKRFIRAGLLNTTNVAIASSSEKADLRFSVSNSYNRGILPNTSLNTTNLNLASTLRFNSKLTLDANINYNKQYSDNFPDVDYGPNSVIYNITIWGGADWNIDDMKNYWQKGKEGVQSIYAEYQRYHNPYFMAYEWLRGHYKNDIYAYTTLTYKINPYVDVLARTSVTTYDLLRTEKMPFSAHPYGREENKGDYREDRRSLFESNTEFRANFKTPLIAKLIGISGFAGANFRQFNYTSSFVTTDYLNVPNVYNFANSRNPVKAYNFASEMRVNSYLYSVDVEVGKYANLNITGRNDKLSALNQNNNSFFYPSFNLSTVLNDYMALPKSINLLKLRASYAKVRGGGSFVSDYIGATPNNSFPLGYGQQYSSTYGGPTYTYAGVYSTGAGYNNTTQAIYTNTLVDSDVKPDDRSSIEIGAEARLLNNRLGFEASYYEYADGPQIFSKAISQTSGYASYVVNGTKTKRTGFDITINGSIIKKANGINWDATLNMGSFRNKLTELPAGVNALNTFYTQGMRTDAVYFRLMARTADGQIINDAGGRPIYLPVAQFAGFSNPDLVWGLNNKVSYKAFSLNIAFDGRVGGIMEDYVRKKTFQGGRHIETVQGAMGEARYQDYKGVKSYIGEGVFTSDLIKYDAVTGKITNMADLKFVPNTTKTYIQDYISRLHGNPEPNIMSKTFFKLREVVLTYELPTTLFKKSVFKRATASFVGRNLLYWMPDTKFNDVDIDQYPGESSIGLQTPTTRSYGFNLNFIF